MSENNDKCNNLRAVQKQLEEATKKAKRLEREARLLRVQEKLKIIFDSLTDSDDLTVWLERNTKTDAKILATVYVKSFDKILEAAADALEREKARRDEVNARRKQENAERRKLKEELEQKKVEERWGNTEEQFPNTGDAITPPP